MSGLSSPSSADVWAKAWRQAFSSRPFIVAVVIMAVAAFGMGAATSFLKLRFRKTPVLLRQPLEKVPQQLGHWAQVSADERLESDIEQTLGTQTYIFRDYVDTRIVGQSEIQAIRNAADSTERARLIADTESRKPRGFMHLTVTYYTGMVDTVAHVPDRCYVADGYVPQDPETRTWKLADDDRIDVRFISFEDATSFSSKQLKNVAYFFQVNGEMASSPMAVRYQLQDLRRADVYYAKVELMSLLRTRADAEKVMGDFLSEALPEIRKCLPARSSSSDPVPTTRQADRGSQESCLDGGGPLLVPLSGEAEESARSGQEALGCSEDSIRGFF